MAMEEKSDGKYPNLIIAGAPKCGTSSLFFWLGAHPEVCASKTKETYFLGDDVNRFNVNLNVHQHGFQAYTKFFRHCEREKYRLEATPLYLYYETPLKHFSRFPDTPKVIFILRNPVEQVYSRYRFNVDRMKNLKLSFREYVERGEQDKYDYLERPRYIDYMMKWIEAVGKENMIVLQFEALTKDNRKGMKALAAQLGISEDFYDQYDFVRRNETRAVSNRHLHQLGLKMQKFIPMKMQEKLLPLYLKLNSQKKRKMTREERDIKISLAPRYKESIDKLIEHFPHIDRKLWM